MARPPACSSSTSSSSRFATDHALARRPAFVADRGDDAHRLDRAVLRHAELHGLSRARVQRLVADGGVLVNGARARRPAQRVRLGDVVALDVAPLRPRSRPLVESLPVHVVYEDDDLLVVNKPPGQVVHPSFRNPSATLLNALLGRARDEGDRWTPHLVQRLDKGTSGLLLVAKSRDVQTALQGAEISKEYLALVWGRPRPLTGRIETRLGRDPLDRRRVMATRSGALAVTEYRTLARTRGLARGLTLLCCRLATGRTHQLRVHLAARGWPLVGEPIYRVPNRERLPGPRAHSDADRFARQALHAWRVRVTHPKTGAAMEFVAGLPDDLRELFGRVGVATP